MSNRPPFASIPLPCACATLRRATRAVSQFYEEALKSTRLRATQFSLLQALELAGEIRQADLAGLLAMDSTTLTRTLRLLQRSAWIESAPGQDRRERMFRLAPQGAAVLKEATPAWQGAQRRLQKALGDANWQSLLPALNHATLTALEISSTLS